MDTIDLSILDKDPFQMSWQELKLYIAAVSAQMRETDRRFEESRKEADRRFEESRKAAERRLVEADRRFEESRKEADRRLEKSRKEADLRFEQSALERKESREKIDDFISFVKQNIRESRDSIRKLENLFSTQWGKLIEALSQPAALKLFRDSDIHIDHIYEGCRKAVYDEHAIEADVILCNKTDVVVVEVKTTCTNEHVQHFTQQMEHFKEAFAEFRDKRVYLAMAAIKYNEHSDKYALKKGLFVLKTSGDGVFTLDKPKVPMTK